MAQRSEATPKKKEKKRKGKFLRRLETAPNETAAKAESVLREACSAEEGTENVAEAMASAA